MVVFDVGRDETGKRIQRWRSGFATKRAATTALNELLGTLADGTYAARTKQTLARFLADWLDAVRPSVRPSTHASYTMQIERHIIPAIGHVRLQNITPAMLNKLYADLLTGGRRIGSGGLHPRSVRYTHMILRRALQSAVRQGLLPRNPADSSDPPKPGRAKEMKTWSPEHLRAFLGHVQGERLYAAWVVLATTGLRRGELLGLPWRNVDLEAGRLAITQTLLSVGYKLSFSTPKTAKGQRSVALDGVTVAALRAHRTHVLEERMMLGLGTPDGDALVFAHPDGTPIHPDSWSSQFDRHIKAYGLPRIRLHDLRHTAATIALVAGVHPKVVSERLGHATVAITLDTYSHSIPALEEQAAETVSRVLFGT